MKRPSFQFYPGDWINDAALRLVSVGARGAWIDMLCLMHQGTPYGHLKVNHKVILPANLARILGATLPETEGWLGELREAGVFDEADDGGIFSRRMVRDEELRQVRAAGGKKGGNPALTGAKKDKPKVDDKVNLSPNLEPTPSSSSSSSSSKEKDAPDGELFPEVPEAVIRDFRKLRNKLRAPITETAANGIRREAEKAGITVEAALRMCCERGWRGFKAEWVTQTQSTQPTAGTPRKRRELGT